jgi:hypothetical protein
MNRLIPVSVLVMYLIALSSYTYAMDLYFKF